MGTETPSSPEEGNKAWVWEPGFLDLRGEVFGGGAAGGGSQLLDIEVEGYQRPGCLVWV